MKEIIEKLKEKTAYLSNLSEKDYENSYLDFLYEDEPVLNSDFDAIAKYFAKEVKMVDYSDEFDDGYHPFLSAPEDLVKRTGCDSFIVCPYKGIIHSEWLDSNYMWQNMMEGGTVFFIDLYDCQYLSEHEIYESILRELYNFQRDASWVLNDIYETKMEEMKARKEALMSDPNIGYFEL